MSYYATTITGTAYITGVQPGGFSVSINGQNVAYFSGAQYSSQSFSNYIELPFDARNFDATVPQAGAYITSINIDVTYHPDSYNITCQNDGHGTLSANKSSATEGTQVTLTPTPASGYVFDHYTISPSSVSISNNKFTMPGSNVTVKAFFRKNYTLVTAGNKIKATDRSQTGTSTTAGAVISDSHFSAGTKAQASTFNSKVLGG